MKFLFYGFRLLMSPEGEGGAGGTGQEGNKPDLAKEFETLKASHAELIKKFEALSAPNPDDKDKSLLDKARDKRAEDDKKNVDTKALENALRFSMGADQFLKTNASLLPKDISDIFQAAEKEKYDSAIEKDAAIKAGIIQSFFSLQANVDLLTPGLKSGLDDYLKLTKAGKHEKSQLVYDSIFEPAFEMLKRTKKAEELNKGYGHGGDDETVYKNKLMEQSTKHYLGVRK